MSTAPRRAAHRFNKGRRRDVRTFCAQIRATTATKCQSVFRVCFHFSRTCLAATGRIPEISADEVFILFSPILVFLFGGFILFRTLAVAQLQ